MKTTKEISKQIATVEKELDQLHKKRDQITGELADLKSDFSKNSDQISKLVQDRTGIDATIQEFTDSLEQLKIDLAEANSDEKQAKNLKKAVELAIKADGIMSSYIEQQDQLENELREKLTRFHQTKIDWKQTVEQFFRTLEAIEPSFENRPFSKTDHPAGSDQARTDLIAKIEKSAKVSTEPARTQNFMRNINFHETVEIPLSSELPLEEWADRIADGSNTAASGLAALQSARGENYNKSNAGAPSATEKVFGKQSDTGTGGKSTGFVSLVDRFRGKK